MALPRLPRSHSRQQTREKDRSERTCTQYGVGRSSQARDEASSVSGSARCFVAEFIGAARTENRSSAPPRWISFPRHYIAIEIRGSTFVLAQHLPRRDARAAPRYPGIQEALDPSGVGRVFTFLNTCINNGIWTVYFQYVGQPVLQIFSESYIKCTDGLKSLIGRKRSCLTVLTQNRQIIFPNLILQFSVTTRACVE